MSSSSQSSRGSEWRKWDLHVHTPGTKKNDQYHLTNGDVWEEFCTKIEISDVHVFGITDYFSADGFFNFMRNYDTRHAKKVFFPNVELCTTDVVNAASEEVNLHIIFNPFILNFEHNIKLFLQNLETSKTDAHGRTTKASELSSTLDFEEATTTRESIKKAFKDTYGDRVDLTDHLLIFTAANNDGIRTATEEVAGKKRGKKRKAVITDEVDKFSHAFFGNSNNTEWFLKSTRLEERTERIVPKPVVSGSDAHSFSDLDNWLGKMVFKDGTILKESTWIKADPTFEGLKQIIYEPACRVFIGGEPEVEIRVRSNQRRYIESLRLDQLAGYGGSCGKWFKDERLELNKELVAIIGNKGSGKSALADSIGLLGNSHNQRYESNGKTEELFSFLNKEKFLRGRCASNFAGELHWYAGDPDNCNLDSNVDENIPENVEYLPQKYLEKICTNIEDDEFRHKLNEVIFGYVEDTYGTNNLEDLISYRSNQTEEDIKLAKERLHDENERLVGIEKKLTPDYKKEIEEKIRRKQAEAKAHNDIRPKQKSAPSETGQQEDRHSSELDELENQLRTVALAILARRTEQRETSKQLEDLRQARQSIERHASALSNLNTEYRVLFSDQGLVFEDIVKLSIDYDSLDILIQAKSESLKETGAVLRSKEDIEILGLSAEELKAVEDTSLLCRQALLDEKKNEIIEQLDKPDRDYQAYLQEEAQWQARQREIEGDQKNPDLETLNWLVEELNAIGTSYRQNLELVKDKRDQLSQELFSKKKGLISFYNSVKAAIDQEIQRHSDDLGDYEISIDASLKFNTSFYEEFFRYVNQSKKGSFYGVEPGKAVLKRTIENVTDWENEEEVFSSLQSIVHQLHHDERDGANGSRDIFKQMKQQKDLVEFYDFLFSFDYLETKYDLKVDGKDLAVLSPGERGGLLLVFYLMLDRRDIPLLIDQPEDNLDNKSVYEILVTFLKKAKKRRQIIIATHNPNLAVVADAEQIIYVSIDKKNENDFDFYAGAIENPEINRRVVDILEGTQPAFDNRKLKYRKQLIPL